MVCKCSPTLQPTDTAHQVKIISGLNDVIERKGSFLFLLGYWRTAWDPLLWC